ncbi:uncharacterized protein LOC129891854 [Solanum dulcamara]|uniref:uncharacterized protein LOC129891854 n=1 Tax=Solanum dulcamara TaxID=45834 RepID=UPI002484E4E7|nr:uncharacterized protein LOC129891854 [Solanum dulcamara]
MAGRKLMDKVHELEEFRLHAYANAELYKEKTKRWHDKHIVTRTFKPGQKVLLFNSHLRLFPGKLRLKWSGPFEVVRMSAHGAVDLWYRTKSTMFVVNVQQVKHYFGQNVDHEEEKIKLKNE